MGLLFSAIVLGLSCAGWVHADTDGVLTLDIALREGMRSPQIEQAQAAVGEKRWMRRQAFSLGFLPKIAISGVHYLQRQYTYTTVVFGGASPLSFPGFYPTTQAALEVSLPLFDGLSNIRQWQASSLLEDSAEQELSQSQFQLGQEIRFAFYEALAARQLQRVADQNVKTLEDHLRQIRLRKQGGVATQYDTLRVEVQLSEAQAEAIDAQDRVQMARNKLTMLLGLEKDDRRLVGSLPAPNTKSIEALTLSDVKERADIQALELRAQAANRQETAKSSWIIPTVSLAGQLVLYNSQLFNQTVTDTGVYKTAYNVGLRLYWNLFDGGASFADAHASRQKAAQAEKAAQIARLKIPYDLAYWKKRYIANSSHYVSKKLDIVRSEESVRLATEEERAGTRTASETLDALMDLFRARAGMLNAQLNAIEAKVRLELVLGRRLE